MIALRAVGVMPVAVGADDAAAAEAPADGAEDAAEADAATVDAGAGADDEETATSRSGASAEMSVSWALRLVTAVNEARAPPWYAA